MMNGSDTDERVIAWQDMPELASREPDEALDERMGNQAPEDCCTLIYTSGTTGNPKGVMITHDNIVRTARQVVDIVEGDHREQLISYLPLSHIAEDTLEFFMSLGIPITEIYGMSECTGSTTISLPQPHRHRTGWTGPAMPGTELTLGEYNEILMRGQQRERRCGSLCL